MTARTESPFLVSADTIERLAFHSGVDAEFDNVTNRAHLVLDGVHYVAILPAARILGDRPEPVEREVAVS